MNPIDIIDKMKTTSVLVVGDIMLDNFVYGEVHRMSPEAPVPVLRITHEERMLGGCGNVVANLAGLGVKPYVAAIVGDDHNGMIVKDMAKEHGADISGIIVDEMRPTTIKTRYVSKAQQLLRTDFEQTELLKKPQVDAMRERVEAHMSQVGAVILSDYNKGVLHPCFIKAVIQAAKNNKVPVLVDPKGDNYLIYAGADVVTPNKKELHEATSGMATNTDDDIKAAATHIIENAMIESVVATRSEAGMSVIESGKDPVHISTEAREVYDVSGAGDTVIAVIAAAMAAGADLESAARLANTAGGIVVGKAGTAAITAEELQAKG